MEIAAMPTNSRTYMIVLDAATIGAEYGPIVRFITSAPMFHGWWNHLPYTFLVSTDSDADAISEGLRPYTKQGRFLVIEVNPTESEGRLPRKGWEWIRHREQQAAPADAS
jgi:hypothetical protein